MGDVVLLNFSAFVTLQQLPDSNAEKSKPFTRRCAGALLFRSDEARSVISCVENKPKIRQTKKSHQTRRGHFQTSPAPEKNVPRFVSAIRLAPSIAVMLWCKRCAAAALKLQGLKPAVFPQTDGGAEAPPFRSFRQVSQASS